MNIVYLHAHDAGRYVSPYGFPVDTPNLMKFAQEGVLFRKAFCAAPTCGPSRSALMSGQYPHEIGMYGLPGTPEGWAFDDYGKHLVRNLRELGFETVLAGCQHETGKSDKELREDLGYERLLNEGREKKGWFYQETIDHVERYLAEPKTRPFFLSVGIDEPHRNNIGRPELGIGGESARFSKTRYYNPDLLDYRYTAPPPFLPDLPEIRKDMASYREGARIMDEYMGRVLYALKHYGCEDNTLVIVTTDHGIEFAGGKKTLSDQGIGVMLMMRGPHGFSGGRVVESLVSQLDIYPTLCELLQIECRSWLRGKSLMPILRGEAQSIHEEIFAEQTCHGKLEPLRCIRTERCKLVLRHYAEGPKLRSDSPCDDLMASIGFYDRPLGAVELFDLYLDPWEHCNRAEDPAYQAIRRELTEKLTLWMSESGDPFPSGSFPEHGIRRGDHR
ncbi:sulfatase [Paenibacillus sp. HB172176]|uniref:sulfatase family protein n=1 Tax=Paenibacillus sp. HB172176 TaxID=2493690 RepID=UPI00143ADF5A|nr:sulfatase [Paenibacillus sp. HB172176]